MATAAVSVAPAGRREKRIRQWGAVALAAVLMASYNSLTAWQESHAFMVNASESLPNWAFFVS